MSPDQAMPGDAGIPDQQINWKDWDAGRWNNKLLHYCFLRDSSRIPSSPIRASEEDLPELVDDPEADPLAMATALLQALRWQARQRDLDPLAYAASRLKTFQPSAAREPDFFGFLWFTCLVAHGYPDLAIDGRFHARFEQFFPAGSIRQHLASLPLLWQALADWLNRGRVHQGQPFSGLLLPAVALNCTLISHSWKLAFPRLLDRRLLQRTLEQLERRGEQLSSRNPLLLELLSRESFSAPFLKELQEHSQALQTNPDHSSWFGAVLDREITGVQNSRNEPLAGSIKAFNTAGRPSSRHGIWGPLLLQSMGGPMGVICLHPNAEAPPPGFVVQNHNPWLPEHPVLVPAESPGSDYAPFDAGSMLLDCSAPPLAALADSLASGVLIFAVDTTLELPRLLLHPLPGLQASHVLVHLDHLDAFQARFDADTAPLEEEDWRGFRSLEASLEELFRFPHGEQSNQPQEQRSRLSSFSGLRLSQGEGFLASGLGLPLVRVHGPSPAIKVLVLDSDGQLADYEPCPADDLPQQWQPCTTTRQRSDFATGSGRIVGFFSGGPTIEQRLPLSRIGVRPRFARTAPLVCREDWGLALGSLQHSPVPATPKPAEAAAVAQARRLLNNGANLCRPVIEQQMLDGLCAAFQQREAISRFDALRLLSRLGARAIDWPLYGEACLRGWCEGGWLEEGIEARRGNWRLQPVDPRLVRLDQQRAQLVGLLSANGLVNLVAHALALNVVVTPINPSCPEMPRGWRFEGVIEELAYRCALPLVPLEDWIPPGLSDVCWVTEPLACDGQAIWPRTSRPTTLHNDPIRAVRDGAHIDRTVAVGDKPPPDLALQLERNCFGHYRWHSRDDRAGRTFTSCHRNRAALDRCVAATNGLWPFGIPDVRDPVLERLYDLDVFLPLPLARLAALCGDKMPGPTRPPNRSQHTYRYRFSREVLSTIVADQLIPLTPLQRPRS